MLDFSEENSMTSTCRVATSATWALNSAISRERSSIRRGSARSARTRRISAISRDRASTTDGFTPVPATASILRVRCSISPRQPAGQAGRDRSGQPAHFGLQRLEQGFDPFDVALIAGGGHALSKGQNGSLDRADFVARGQAGDRRLQPSHFIPDGSDRQHVDPFGPGAELPSRLASLAMSSLRNAGRPRSNRPSWSGRRRCAVCDLEERRDPSAGLGSLCRERISATAFLTASRGSTAPSADRPR